MVGYRDALLITWLREGERNLAEFKRSPFHEELRNESRDSYTNLFEKHPTEALAKVRDLLVAAKITDPTPSVHVSKQDPRRVLGAKIPRQTEDHRHLRHHRLRIQVHPDGPECRADGGEGSRSASVPQQSLCVSRPPSHRLVPAEYPGRK